jgi:hypothetical protein
MARFEAAPLCAKIRCFSNHRLPLRGFVAWTTKP